jgi:hypothetical protein
VFPPRRSTIITAWSSGNDDGAHERRFSGRGDDMPIGLTDPLTATNFSSMSVEELCDRHRQLLQRIREVDHWHRLIGARLDLAVAAVADLPEPVSDPAPLIPALAAELGGSHVIRRALSAAGVTSGLSFTLDEDDDLLGDGRDPARRSPAIPVATPPDGLRDLLGIPRFEERLTETALLPRLRQAMAELDAYGEALRAVTEEAAHVIALRMGAAQLPA